MIVRVIVGGDSPVRRRMIKTKTKKTASAYSPTIKPLQTANRSQCKLACQPLPGAGMNTRPR
jgi:hypothetical protein